MASIARSDYRDQFSTQDVIFWLAVVIARGGDVPHWKDLCAQFGMNRATAFRWRRWALDKQQTLYAREGLNDDV